MRTLKSQLQQLLGIKRRGSKRLAASTAAQALAGNKGIGRPAAGTAQGSTVAPPLIEAKNSRLYHNSRELQSSDGLFVFTYRPIKSMTFVDRRGVAFPFWYEDLG